MLYFQGVIIFVRTIFGFLWCFIASFTKIATQHTLASTADFQLNQKKLASEPRKKPSYFLLYWMVNRDPYSGLL